MISEEERKAIEILKEFRKTGYTTLMVKYYGDRIKTNTIIKMTIDTVLNLIETQNKMIELMAEDIKDADDYIYSELNKSDFSDYNTQQIIEYFRNKAKESE